MLKNNERSVEKIVFPLLLVNALEIQIYMIRDVPDHTDLNDTSDLN